MKAVIYQGHGRLIKKVGDLTLIDKKYLKLGVTIIKYAHFPPHIDI